MAQLPLERNPEMGNSKFIVCTNFDEYAGYSVIYSVHRTSLHDQSRNSFNSMCFYSHSYYPSGLIFQKDEG